MLDAKWSVSNGFSLLGKTGWKPILKPYKMTIPCSTVLKRHYHTDWCDMALFWLYQSVWCIQIQNYGSPNMPSLLIRFNTLQVSKGYMKSTKCPFLPFFSRKTCLFEEICQKNASKDILRWKTILTPYPFDTCKFSDRSPSIGLLRETGNFPLSNYKIVIFGGLKGRQLFLLSFCLKRKWK